jgi:hypothetical protein
MPKSMILTGFPASRDAYTPLLTGQTSHGIPVQDERISAGTNILEADFFQQGDISGA